MQIHLIEKDLRLLLNQHPYTYPQHHDRWADTQTNFIYSVNTYQDLMTAIHTHLANHQDRVRLTTYALYRWFNRMVSKACEWKFCQHPGVRPEPNEKHPTIDLYVNNIGYDVKATVIPSAFTLRDAAANPKDALNWYYKNQSDGSRYDINNRLIVAKQGYWYRKCELSKIMLQIDNFMLNWNSAIQKSTKISGLESGLILVA